jgi:hypothetical protein
MDCSYPFIELQVDFCKELTKRFGIPFEESVLNYTNLGRQLGLNDSSELSDRFFTFATETLDLAQWTWQFYSNLPAKPLSSKRIFGYFNYDVRDVVVLRMHLVGTENSPMSVLGSEFQSQRIQEITELQRHVANNEPHVLYAKGCSWLYNLEAYQRLFPPKFIQAMAEPDYDQFSYLSLWGQFLNRDGSIRQNFAKDLFSRLDSISDIGSLMACFPNRPLIGVCEIEVFRHFYGITSSETSLASETT